MLKYPCTIHFKGKYFYGKILPIPFACRLSLDLDSYTLFLLCYNKLIKL